MKSDQDVKWPDAATLKEIDLIQSCIQRMNANSFEIKKWTVGLIAVIAGLWQKGSSCLKGWQTAGIFLMVIILFWCLDAFFLKTERLYRKKYEWLIQSRKSGNDEYRFDLNPYEKAMGLNQKDIDKCVILVMCSKTLLPFYGGLMLFCGVICYLFSA